MSHPSLGLPPTDRISDLPPAAARVAAARERLAGRALEIAIDRDPTIRARYDEHGVRRLLRDSEVLVDRVVESLATGDPGPAREFADAAPPAYRRRQVPMNDLIAISRSIRDAVGAVLPATEMDVVDEAVEAMVERFAWHGRIAGDGRKKNRLLQAIYKGA